MGNPDLVIVINKRAFIIKGAHYCNRKAAIEEALFKFNKYWDNMAKMGYDNPDFIFDVDDIQTIEVYVLIEDS